MGNAYMGIAANIFKKTGYATQVLIEVVPLLQRVGHALKK